MQKYFLIAIGGGLGSVMRVWVTIEADAWLGSAFSYGTMAVNLCACLAIGFLLSLAAKRAATNSPWRFLVAVGFIGAFSTFSTFEWETYSTLASGALLLAATYAASSVMLGLIAVWSGAKLATAVA
jgi:fluoride exporter